MIKTVKSGLWSDPATWEGGKVPGNADQFSVSQAHTIILDADPTVAGGEILGILVFQDQRGTLFQSSGNIVVRGIGMWTGQPNASVIHIIRFIGINEDKFVGDGMVVLDSDIGLWVMDSGKLDFDGFQKTPWTRTTTGGIKTGDTAILLAEVKNWSIGDELAIMPTAPGQNNYDERTVKAVSGLAVALNTPATAHPQITGFPEGEVANLTRNFRIEGTATGRSHVFIHSTVPQRLNYVAFRYMGPRKNQGGSTAKEFVLGRYALHFHHCGYIKGTEVIGCVMRDCGSHVAVPHGSHGINMTWCVSYNTIEAPFWYDIGHATHDLLWSFNLAARMSFVPGSIDMNLKATDPDTPPTFSCPGFVLGMGDNNKCLDCVVVGATGDPHDTGGFFWNAKDENKNEGVWEFARNLAHNCSNGLEVWQNTSLNHLIEDYYAYSNGQDIYHGAYGNSYIYRNIFCNGLVEIKAGGPPDSTARLTFVNLNCRDLHMLESPVPSKRPVFFLFCNWKTFTDSVTAEIHSADMVGCNGLIYMDRNVVNGETIRVQPKSGQAYMIKQSGSPVTTNISRFAPDKWGNGSGLLGEYYNDSNFKTLVFSRIDSYINFDAWANGVHHLVTSPNMSVRWTGRMLAQFTEEHIFTLSGDESCQRRLWVDGVQIINNKPSGKAKLTAGKWHDIKIEYANSDTSVAGGMNWQYSSPSLNTFGAGYVPMMNLMAPDIILPPPPPPPVNQVPKVDAGPNWTITEGDVITVVGNAFDPDGVITSYKWAFVPDHIDDDPTKPAPGTIVTPESASTVIKDLVYPGIYQVQLTVTDNNGATAVGRTNIQVNKKQNSAPVVDAGQYNAFDLFYFPLTGKATDSDGIIEKVQWTQLAGPSDCNIVNDDQLIARAYPADNVKGDYTFKLEVTDDKGAISSSKVTHTIK